MNKSTFVKPINLLIGVLIGSFIVNRYGMEFLRGWKFEYNTVAIEYLRIFLGMPAVVLIVLLVFFSKFYSSIDYFIRNMRVKYKDVEATSQQAKNIQPDGPQTTEANEAEVVSLSKQDVQVIAEEINNIRTDNQTKQQAISELRELVVQLANRSEFFEFMYLNNILVISTKSALLSLYTNGPQSKALFIENVKNIFIPPMVLDKETEKLAIHNALLVNGLIEETGALIKVSEKGERYLKFIGLIK